MAEVVQVLVIEQDFCPLTFGSAPCQAALTSTVKRKCHQTFHTCGDPDNFASGTLELKFCRPTVSVPKDMVVFDVIDSIKEDDTTVNLSGSDPTMSAFGRRAKLSVTFREFVYHDRMTDRYTEERKSGAAQNDEPGYDPSRGQFFKKLIARWPHYAKRRVHVDDYEVQSDGSWLLLERRTYFITKLDPSGMDSAKLEAEDAFSFAKNNSAVLPAPTNGKMKSAITTTSGSVTLSPSGVGAEYSASGYVAFGGEIAAFSRTGDVLTLTQRGFSGSTLGPHDEGTTVRECYYADNISPQELLQDIFEGAGVDPSHIPLADWEEEFNTWLPGLKFQGIIPESTAAEKITPEISVLGISMAWDLSEKEIRVRVDRPVGNDPEFEVTDDDIISIEYERRDDKRLTEVIFWHRQMDATRGVSEDNFEVGEYIQSADAKDPRGFGDFLIHQEYIRWLNNGNSEFVRIAGKRFLKRFQEAPVRVTVKVKAKKYRDARLMDVVWLSSDYAPPDASGKTERRSYQIIRKSRPSESGEVTLTLQSYEYFGNYAEFTENNEADYDLVDPQDRHPGAWFGPNTGDTFADGSDLFYFS